MAITYLDSSGLVSALGGVKFIGWASRLTSLGTRPTHPAVSLLWSLLVQFQASRGSSEREPCWFGKGKAWGGCVSLELGWASFLPS